MTYLTGCEIMFHVAPLLPLSNTEEQQLERKRFIANDFVIIIFKEDHQPIQLAGLMSNTNRMKKIFFDSFDAIFIFLFDMF